MPPLETISVRGSSLTSYHDCPRRAAARTYRKIITEAGYDLNETLPHIGAVSGTGCHAGAAYMLANKLTFENLGSIDDCNEVAIEAFRAEAVNGVAFDQISPEKNTAEKQLLRQVAMYRKMVAPIAQPLDVEVQLEDAVMNVDGKQGIIKVTMTGKPDDVEERLIRDLKTGGKQRWNAAQYGHYSLMVRASGRDVDQLIEDFIARTPLRKPQADVEFRSHDVGTAEQMAVRIIERMARDMEEFTLTGERWAFAVNPMSMLCSPKFCPAWGTNFCREHAPED